MQITKLTDCIGIPNRDIPVFTDEELNNELNYYLSQKITKSMLDKGLISIDEYNKITEKNRRIFSPYLGEIMN